MNVYIVLLFWWFLLIPMVVLSRSYHKIVAWVMWHLCEKRLCDDSELNGKSLPLQLPFYYTRRISQLWFTGQSAADTDLAPTWPTPSKFLYKLLGNNVLRAYMIISLYLFTWIHFIRHHLTIRLKFNKSLLGFFN